MPAVAREKAEIFGNIFRTEADFIEYLKEKYWSELITLL